MSGGKIGYQHRGGNKEPLLFRHYAVTSFNISCRNAFIRIQAQMQTRIVVGLLGLLLNKRLGFYHFDPRVRVVMAANEVMDAPGGWPLAPALANRICHIAWPDHAIDSWCSFLIGGGKADDGPTVNTADEEARVLAAHPAAYAKAAGYMAAFSRAKRTYPSPMRRNRSRLDPGASASTAWRRSLSRLNPAAATATRSAALSSKWR